MSTTPVQRAQAALDILAALGTVEAIRDYLIGQGIRGPVGDCQTCPIAEYLARAAGEAEAKVSVSTEFATVWHTPVGRVSRLPLPTVVSEFISLFDEDRRPLPSWAPLYAEATP